MIDDAALGRILHRALQAGGDFAEVFVEDRRVSSARLDDAKIEELTSGRERGAGIRVVAAGLDQDYLRRPFGPMPALLSVAEEISKMHAVCVRCGGAAHYSQRIAGGSSQVEVGDTSYEARCRFCFETYQPREENEPVQLPM